MTQTFFYHCCACTYCRFRSIVQVLYKCTIEHGTNIITYILFLGNCKLIPKSQMKKFSFLPDLCEVSLTYIMLLVCCMFVVGTKEQQKKLFKSQDE